MEWRKVVGFPDYEVREDGVVRRVTDSRQGHPIAGRIRKNCIDPRSGYAYIALMTEDCRTLRRSIHGIVAEAFIGPKPTPNHEVAHRDGSKSGNHYTNLRWSTKLENIEDMVIHGTDHRGKKHWNAKTSEDTVREIRKRFENGEKQASLAREFNMHSGQVYKIISRQRWRHLQ